LKDTDSPFVRVEEREVAGEIFQVSHRLLRIPREVYLDVLSQHREPFSEIAAQDFVEQYLKWCGDRDGVIGMVRFDEEESFVVLDAAVRYRINPHDRPSCHTE
jgi:hypothetical protein